MPAAWVFLCFCSHTSMLRPVLPLNLTPRDDEKVAAGVAALLATCAFMLLLGAFILAFNLLDRPLLGLSKRV